jgi:hypothetical protein
MQLRCVDAAQLCTRRTKRCHGEKVRAIPTCNFIDEEPSVRGNTDVEPHADLQRLEMVIHIGPIAQAAVDKSRKSVSSCCEVAKFFQ